jgi:glycine/D-amino acid oxidase-like deaminating enzyme
VTPLGELDRRTFLKVAGASAGLLAAGPSALASQEPIGAPALIRNAPDVVVIGAGTFGGWTALNLIEQGATVAVVDAWGPGNSRSTSGDETRGIRTSYGDREHGELWARWAREAIGRWRAFDETYAADLKLRLFFHTGDLILRPESQPFLEDTRKNWDAIGTEYEVLAPAEVEYRWPGVFDLEDVGTALYEPQAGVGRARRSCEAVAEVLRQKGCDITIARARPGLQLGDRLNDIVLSNHDAMAAGQFVFATGPWLGKTFPELMGNRMRTPLGYVFYFGTPLGDNRFTFPNLPSWNLPGVTGWPALPVDNRGFRVRTGGGGNQDPDVSQRWIPEAGVQRARDFLASTFPGLKDMPLAATHACHYELTTSRNFVVDRHPDLGNVWFAGGGNAEGFKFGPVIGEYVARRVLGSDTDEELAAQFRLPEPYEVEAAGTPE